MRRALLLAPLAFALLAPGLARADTATPAAGIPAERCTVTPLTRAQIDADVAALPATPPIPIDSSMVADLPAGTPASPEHVALVQRTEETYAACYNGANYPAMLALLTPDARAFLLYGLVTEGSLDDFLATTGTPETFGDGTGPNLITSVTVSGARELPDGRLAAIVIWTTSRYGDREANFHVYEATPDGSLLLAEEISVMDMPPIGTPTP